MLVPALLTRTSSAGMEVTSFVISAEFVTSQTAARALPPAARIPAAACSISSFVRAASQTLAPACASATAQARPMPRPAPVTSAARPSRRNFSRMLKLLRGRFVLRAQAHVLPAVAAQPQVGLLLVAPEALDGAQARAVLADLHRGFGRDLLVGAGLQELADPEAAGVARGAEGGEGVVGADHLVAVGHVGLGPEEERAVVAHVLEEVARLPAQDLDVLGGNAVGFLHSFFP